MPAGYSAPVISGDWNESWSTMRKIELILVARDTVTSMPLDLPGMFPNRLAWPPDLPMTMFCEPETPLVVLLLTSVPAPATLSFNAFVRRTVSLVLGGCVNPPGVDCAVYGNGVTLPPTLSSLPGILLATTLLMSSVPGLTGRAPAGVDTLNAGSMYGTPGRPPGCGMPPTEPDVARPLPKGSGAVPAKLPQPESEDGRPSRFASQRVDAELTWVFQSSGIDVDVRFLVLDGRML